MLLDFLRKYLLFIYLCFRIAIRAIVPTNMCRACTYIITIKQNEIDG